MAANVSSRSLEPSISAIAGGVYYLDSQNSPPRRMPEFEGVKFWLSSLFDERESSVHVLLCV